MAETTAPSPADPEAMGTGRSAAGETEARRTDRSPTGGSDAARAGPATKNAWLLAALAPLAASALIVLKLDPSLWFRDAIPAMTDLTGHLLPPMILRDELLPAFRIQGWSGDWFAGFPVYRFYFPLPGLLVAGLSTFVGDATALRLVAMLPLVLLPWALFLFGRWAGLGVGRTVGATLVGASSVLMVSHRMLGGNIFSVVGGEFSYGWSLVFLILYLGLCGKGGVRRSRGVAAGVALAAAILCHVVPVLVVALGLLPFLAHRPSRPVILGSWIVAGALTAFWTLPMVTALGHVGSLDWAVVPTVRDIVPLELLPLILPAGYGLLLTRRYPALAMMVCVAASALLLAGIPQGFVMRGRPLPLWFLAVHVFAGAGIANAWIGGTRAVAARWATAGVAVLGTGGWVLLMSVRDVDASQWRIAMEGLPARPGAAALEATMEHMASLPPGRVYWEPGDRSRYGGSFVPALVPYWTHHTSLAGLWHESSPSSEFLFALDRGFRPDIHTNRDLPPLDSTPQASVDRLRMLGVRYLITHSSAIGAAMEETLGSPEVRHGGLRVFDLGEAALVEAVPCWTSPAPGSSVRDEGLEWFAGWEPGVPLLLDPGWPGAQEGGVRCRPDDGGEPLQVDVTSPGSIRFRTPRPGVPHLVRVSYFPAWRARGADGPYRAAPWFMVVVPRGPEVTVEYATEPTRRGGLGITLIALGFLGWGAGRQRRSPGGARPFRDSPRPG